MTVFDKQERFSTPEAYEAVKDVFCVTGASMQLVNLYDDNFYQ